MKDFGLYETGYGGDLSILNNDIEMVSSLSNQVYIALFGGNIGYVTRNDFNADQQRLDFWGNSLIYRNNSRKQFNSLTEHFILNSVINSAFRSKLIDCVKRDLEYLDAIFVTDINVIIDTNNIKILVSIFGKDNVLVKNIELVWDTFKKQVIILEEL